MNCKHRTQERCVIQDTAAVLRVKCCAARGWQQALLQTVESQQ